MAKRKSSVDIIVNGKSRVDKAFGAASLAFVRLSNSAGKAAAAIASAFRKNDGGKAALRAARATVRGQEKALRQLTRTTQRQLRDQQREFTRSARVKERELQRERRAIARATRTAERELARKSKAAIRSSREERRALRQSARAYTSFGNTIRGVASSIAVFFSVRAIKRFLGESIELFGRQEQAEQKLADALKVIGAESDGALDRLKAFASEIQRTTTLGDEAVLEIAALGASLGKLSGEQLEDATVAAIGLSAATGKTLREAMVAVAKAAQGQFDSLRENGIVFDKSMSQQEKFNELLKIGANNFALAEGQAETLAGKIGQLGNSWSALKEQIAARLAPAMEAALVNVIATVDALTAALSGSADGVERLGKIWQRVMLSIEENVLAVSVQIDKLIGSEKALQDDLKRLSQIYALQTRLLNETFPQRDRPAPTPIPRVDDIVQKQLADGFRAASLSESRFLTGVTGQNQLGAQAIPKRQLDVALRQERGIKTLNANMKTVGDLLRQFLKQNADPSF